MLRCRAQRRPKCRKKWGETLRMDERDVIEVEDVFKIEFPVVAGTELRDQHLIVKERRHVREPVEKLSMKLRIDRKRIGVEIDEHHVADAFERNAGKPSRSASLGVKTIQRIAERNA